MNELMRFLAWAKQIGHYHAVEAVERYLAILQTDEYRELKQGHDKEE